jgi:hypothetical protein
MRNCVIWVLIWLSVVTIWPAEVRSKYFEGSDAQACNTAELPWVPLRSTAFIHGRADRLPSPATAVEMFG